MLEYLINSQTRRDILALFFQKPEAKYYAREIVKRLELDPANLHKELNNLVAGEFLLTETKAGKKYFQLNPANVYFTGLTEIFRHYPGRPATKYPQLICVEEMVGYYPMMATFPWNTYFANKFFQSLGLKRRFSCLMNTYQDNLCRLIVPKAEFTALGLEILNKVKDEPGWGEKYIRDLRQTEAALYQASDDLNRLNFKKFSDAALARTFHDYYEIYGRLHINHWIQTALDFDDNVFSKYLMAHLQAKIKGTKYSLGEAFSILTTPTEEAKPAEEYRKLLLILKEIDRRLALKKYFISTETRIIVQELPQKGRAIFARLQKHAADFGFLGYGTLGPAWDLAYFIDILSSLARQGADPDKLLIAAADNRCQVKARQAELEKGLRLDANHRRIFEFARNLVLTKGARKDSMFYSYSIIENLFKEIGRRHYLSLRQIRYLHPFEVRKLLLDKDFPITVLNERYQFSLNFSLGRYEEDINLTGVKAQQFLNSLDIIQPDLRDIKTLTGDCASPGRVRGAVKIINQPKDMVKMNRGDILVSLATTPDLVPAIKMAAAIVTDAGGITCHAAIISRELGISCVVGTKIATKVLHDGDIIDVDATHGKVDIIKKAGGAEVKPKKSRKN